MNELEFVLHDLKVQIDRHRSVTSSSNLILGCGTLFTVGSIFTMPKWTSVILVAMLSGYTIYSKTRTLSIVSSELDKIKSIFDNINESLIEMQAAELKGKEENETSISFLKSTIERLKALLAKKESSPSTANNEDAGPTQAELNLNELLKKIQKLDSAVEDFGDECASYMRKEFSKTLRVCGLEFVDYSDENKSVFDTETAAINNIDCTSRAIVTRSTPQKAILRGHAFIPET